jgi:invasion protein IalB
MAKPGRTATLVAALLFGLVAWGAAAQQQPGSFTGAPGAAADTSGLMSGGGVVRQQFGDWSELCQSESGPGADRCILVQNIESANRPGFGLATVVRKVPGEASEATMMHIYVPLGIYLPKGLGLQIDEQLVGNTPFWSCIPFQCEARVTLPAELIDKLIAGNRALFAVYENPTKGTVLPISLRGFAEGLRALTAFAPETGAAPQN